jgi:Tfp pilus assembly protein PilE
MYQTYACARCGFVNPTHARACAECGTANPAPSPFLPPPPNAVGTGGIDGGTVAKWVIGLVAVGFVGVVLIGIVAAIAIPKFAGVSKSAKEAEARGTLSYMHSLQDSYRQLHGAYQANLDDPEDAGHFSGGPGYGAKYYHLSISEASDAELCIDAMPNELGAAARIRAFSMDEAGVLYDGSGCSGVPENAGAFPVDESYEDGAVPAWEGADDTAVVAPPVDEKPAAKMPKP